MSQAEESIEPCPVCLDIMHKKCYTRCNHMFCQECIVKVLQSNNDDICPVCRNPIKLTDIKLYETNGPLLPNLKICGGVYIQGNEEGLASYHFDSETDCYISYASPSCIMWPSLDDGERPPIKKPFVNVSINEIERTFCGEIHWAPTAWIGDVLWSYKMHFSEDYDSIVSGNCVAYDSVENGNSLNTHEFGSTLIYRRLYSNDLKMLLQEE